ncbi:MAG: hypothetical protein ACRC8M_13890 [Cetobacterium sp.]|uniref:hypothetical protein n=1 Tax=Cetobacterium sp. TaxID=2071632 RepID=UPI003F3ED36B
MVNIYFGISLVAATSILCNWVLLKKIKMEKFAKENNYNDYLDRDKKFKKYMENQSKELKIKNNRIEKLECEIDKMYDKNADLNLELMRKTGTNKKIQEKYKNIIKKQNTYYKELESKHETQLEINENLYKSFKNKEKELFYLEWAYDELINSYKKMDKELYYWRLITAPKPLKKNQFLFYNKNKTIGLR